MTSNKKALATGNSKGSCKPSVSRPNNDTSLTVWDAIEAFRDTLQENSLGRPEIKPDAGIQRFKVEGDRGNNKSGWYNFHTDGDIPAGAYGHWRTGLSATFYFKKDNKPLTDSERKELARIYADAKRKREFETQKKYAEGRRISNGVLNKGVIAKSNHPYLVKKCCQGASKYLKQDAKGNLLVPLYNDKRLVSIQYINKHGGKFFVKGSQLKGSYFLFGDVKQPFDTVYIVEGISTGWTVFTLTDKSPTFCAMNASNLKNVALRVRKQWPEVEVIICADNDVRADEAIPNTGVEEAKKAALSVNGRVSIPSMPDGSKCDFNDLYVLAIESQNNKKQGVTQ